MEKYPKLKPCPFCGSANGPFTATHEDYRNVWVFVRCGDCGAEGPKDRGEQESPGATNLWNEGRIRNERGKDLSPEFIKVVAEALGKARAMYAEDPSVRPFVVINPHIEGNPVVISTTIRELSGIVPVKDGGWFPVRFYPMEDI